MSRSLDQVWSYIGERVRSLEEIPLSPWSWAAGILGIIVVRHLLEIRAASFPIYQPLAFYVHYPLAYLAPLLALCLVLASLSGVRIERVLRLMLLAWGLTLLPPLVDALLAREHTAQIGYLRLEETPLGTIFLRFFDPSYELHGTTPGIRIEAAIACLLGAFYVYLRAQTMKGVRAAATAAAVYATSLFFFTLPYLFARAVRIVFPEVSLLLLREAVGRVVRPLTVEARSDQIVLLYLIPLTLLLGALAAALARPDALRRALKEASLSEGWFGAVAAALGAFAGWRILQGVPRPADPIAYDWLALIVLPVSMFFALSGLTLLLRASAASSAEASDARFLRGIGAATLASGFLLATALGNAAGSMTAVAVGAILLAHGLPRLLPWAILLPEVSAGIASVAAATAGYSLLAGDDALVLLPMPTFALVFLAGFVSVLPLSAMADGGRLTAGLQSMPAAAPLVVLIGCTVVLGAPALPATIIAAAMACGATALSTRTLAPALTSALAMLGASVVLAFVLADPVEAGAWRARALDSPAYFMRVSRRAEEAGDSTTAVGAAAEAVRRAPKLASAHERLGLARLKRGDAAGAVEALHESAALDPDSAGPHANLASALLQAGRFEDALHSAERAIAIDAKSPSPYFIRAQCLDALKRPAEATVAWREYLARAEGFPDEAPYVDIARRRLGGQLAP